MCKTYALSANILLFFIGTVTYYKVNINIFFMKITEIYKLNARGFQKRLINDDRIENLLFMKSVRLLAAEFFTKLKLK